VLEAIRAVIAVSSAQGTIAITRNQNSSRRAIERLTTPGDDAGPEPGGSRPPNGASAPGGDADSASFIHAGGTDCMAESHVSRGATVRRRAGRPLQSWPIFRAGAILRPRKIFAPRQDRHIRCHPTRNIPALGLGRKPSDGTRRRCGGTGQRALTSRLWSPGSGLTALVSRLWSAGLDPDRCVGVFVRHPQTQRRGGRSPALLNESAGAGGKKIEQLRHGNGLELDAECLQNLFPG